MRPPTWSIAVLAVLASACATASNSPRRADSGGPLDPAVQKAVFDLVQISTICLKFNQPNQAGRVVLKGIFSEPGNPARIVDEESSPGNERAIACAVEQAWRVKSPPASRPRFVIYSIPLPF